MPFHLLPTLGDSQTRGAEGSGSSHLLHFRQKEVPPWVHLQACPNTTLEVNFHISNSGLTFLLWACGPQTPSAPSPQSRVFSGRPRASHWQLVLVSAALGDWRSLEGKEVCESCFPPLRPLFWPSKSLYSFLGPCLPAFSDPAAGSYWGSGRGAGRSDSVSPPCLQATSLLVLPCWDGKPWRSEILGFVKWEITRELYSL